MTLPSISHKVRRDRIRTNLINKLGVDISVQGSVAGVIVDSVLSSITSVINNVSILDNNRNLLTASDTDLDALGRIYGLTRSTGGVASLGVSDGGLVISATRGKLRARLGSVVPAGTKIEIGGTTMEVASNVTIPPNASQIRVPLLNSGSLLEQDIDPGIIDNSQFGEGIQLRLLAPIKKEFDPETDEEYRNRIIAFVRGSSISTLGGITSLLKSLANVSDVKVLSVGPSQGVQGIMLIPRGNRLDSRTLEQARSIVRQFSAAGCSLAIHEPNYRQVSIEVSVSCRSENKNQIANALKTAMYDILNVVEIGATLNVNDVLRLLSGRFAADITDMKLQCLKLDGRKLSTGVVRLGPTDVVIPADGKNAIHFQVN